jgi:UDP-2,3-diacylglucosamine pyrophosphatase LpxH
MGKLKNIKYPVYVISDLHMGDETARDNFAVGNRIEELKQFAEHVKRTGGSLIINGDLFELWQAGLGSILKQREEILDLLADIDAVFIVGNHDIDLHGLVDTEFMGHPFFQNMRHPFSQKIGTRNFHFMHGHETDKFNQGDKPGEGRVLTIVAGIVEDKVGSPFFDPAYKHSVENVLTKAGEWILWAWNIVVSVALQKNVGMKSSVATPRQRPSLIDQHTESLKAYKEEMLPEVDTVIAGHTHKMGRAGDWYANSGSWAEGDNDVLMISSDGEVTFHHFKDGKLKQNDSITDLPVPTTDKPKQ